MRLRFAGLVALLAVVWLAVGSHLLHADPQVAFLGDSITARWQYPRANFGIRGNTTAQMLERFPGVIPGHGFRKVVILGGTNDLLLQVDNDVTIHNLEQLGDATLAQNAQPILCEIPPIFHDYKLEDTRNYGSAVMELNRRIVQLAEAHHWKLVDYYTPLEQHPTYSADGVHWKRRGYLVMEVALLHQLAQ